MSCPATLSNYLINKIMKVLTNQGTYTSPATVYVALYTSNPNPDNSGTEVSTSGTAYVRQAVVWSTVGTGNTADNNATITFPTATAGYGTVSYIALFDAQSSGNLLAFAPATSSIAVLTGNVYQINTTALSLSFQ